MTTCTIEGVELVKVGNWASALSGRVPITEDDLDSMVAAAQDAEVDHAPVKLGHVDPRFDGEPALGWLSNVRRVGSSVVADLTGVPEKMRAVIENAFRRRSAEIAWGVRTPSGKSYKASLSGLALLGVTAPAVKGLADITTMYSAPKNDVEGRGAVTVVDGDDSVRAVALGAALTAAADYAAALDGDPGQPRAIAAMSLLSSSGDLPQTVAEPVLDDRHQSLEGAVTDEQVREALGLAEDAAVTDLMRQVVTVNTDAAKAKAEADTAAATQADKDAADAKAKADADAATAAAAQAPTVTVDRAALEQLQSNASAGAEALRILNEQDRERELTVALSAGKIAPSSVDQYRALWNTNKDQTKALLAGLPQVFSTVTNFSAAPSTTGGQQYDENGIPESAWKAFEDDIAKTMRNGG